MSNQQQIQWVEDLKQELLQNDQHVAHTLFLKRSKKTINNCCLSKKNGLSESRLT